MGSEKYKIEFTVPKSEVGAVLGKIAEGLESGSLDLGEAPVEIEGFSGLKCSVKDEGDAFFVKIKVKLPKADKIPSAVDLDTEGLYEPGGPLGESGSQAEESPEAAEGCECEEAPKAEKKKKEKKSKKGMPKYSKLKERMKDPWKAILDSLEKGSIPDDLLSRPFLNDCRLMLAYEGKGDEYYEEFGAKLELFAEALAHRRLSDARNLARELESQKKACHDRYK